MQRSHRRTTRDGVFGVCFKFALDRLLCPIKTPSIQCVCVCVCVCPFYTLSLIEPLSSPLTKA